MSNTVHTYHATATVAVNEALITLGQDVLASSLAMDSTDPIVKKSAYIYDSARKKVLRDHDWNFARRETIVNGCLAVCPGQDEHARLPFSVPTPAHCIRVIACMGEGRRGQVEWSIVGTDIRSTEPIARIVYIYDVEDLDRWSPDAYRALILRLAADLAKPITGRINERNLQEQAYANALADAKLSDARESNISTDPWDEATYSDAMSGRAIGRERGLGRRDFLRGRW